MTEPEEFIIKHRRKKYRFAVFANSPLCFELDEWSQQQISCLEIGAGTGLLSVAWAADDPHRSYVALDAKGDRLQKGATHAAGQGLTNVRFLRARADQVDQAFPAQSLPELWLTFPDPFPRARSAARRLTHPVYLEKFAAILAKDGRLHFKHDNPEFFAWSAEQFTDAGWRVADRTSDLHASDLPHRYKIPTTYEQRWLEAGRTISYLNASPPAASSEG